jgi:hypothetical protein
LFFLRKTKQLYSNYPDFNPFQLFLSDHHLACT